MDSPASPPRSKTGRSRRPLGRDLPTAIATGLALGAAFLISLFAHPYAFLALVAAVVVVALLELDVGLRARDLRPATPVAVGAGVVMVFGAYASGRSGQSLGLMLLLLGVVVWLLVDAAAHRAIREGRSERILAALGATCLVTLWVPLLASFAGLLLAREGTGRWLVATVVGLTVVNDIAAFGWGVRFGSTPLAPAISPGKTWEGFAGGLGTVLAVATVVAWLTPLLDLRSALILGAVITVAATLGDLSESLVKRDLGVKDLGAILPGHGGIMDRVDALLFAFPAAELTLRALGM
ncbi:MAG TPA: phosphatidate cytidylyltransferase [Egibacteraceae bacterium]|nr:phosphatidate cytidylyltransferase [Egibacteraceae bacterium]